MHLKVPVLKHCLKEVGLPLPPLQKQLQVARGKQCLPEIKLPRKESDLLIQGQYAYKKAPFETYNPDSEDELRNL